MDGSDALAWADGMMEMVKKQAVSFLPQVSGDAYAAICIVGDLRRGRSCW